MKKYLKLTSYIKYDTMDFKDKFVLLMRDAPFICGVKNIKYKKKLEIQV